MKAEYQTYIGETKSNYVNDSEIFNNVYFLNGFSERNEMEYLQKSVGQFCHQGPGLHALDLTAGRGVSAMALAKMGFNVTAFNMYTNAISLLQKLALQQEMNISFGKGAISHLANLNKKFDVIHDLETLSDTVSTAERTDFLYDLKNTLADDGLVVMTVKVLSSTYDPADSFESVYLAPDYVLWRQTPATDIEGVIEMDGKHWTAHRRIAPAELIRLELAAAGFAILSEEIELIPGCPSTLKMVLVKA
jgi:2-polyprenyl-6-hydroxyphenyl methylase/3-demethylubiquinone-9 3-methyltransferase